MGIYLIFIAGLFVFIITVIALMRAITHRVKSPTEDLKEEISILKKRVEELEKESKT